LGQGPPGTRAPPGDHREDEGEIPGGLETVDGLEGKMIKRWKKGMSVVDEIRRIKKKHEASILARKNVVGLGVGYKETKEVKTDPLIKPWHINCTTPIETIL
jgi:hypothetical protein